MARGEGGNKNALANRRRGRLQRVLTHCDVSTRRQKQECGDGSEQGGEAAEAQQQRAAAGAPRRSGRGGGGVSSAAKAHAACAAGL